MQQTEKYQFNLIEPSDKFSPDPLNENMEKVEEALAAKTDAGDHAALERRVVSLEGSHIAAGTYVGVTNSADNSPQFIDLGFTPAMVVASLGSGKTAVLVRSGGTWAAGAFAPAMTLTEGGFIVCNAPNLELNIKNKEYPYIAIG